MNAKDYKPEILKAWRVEAGKTQQDVADHFGIAKNTVGRVELGHNASYEILKSFCKYYGKDLKEVLRL
jgi:transcriptional regulator with XRE-family HTH domain